MIWLAAHTSQWRSKRAERYAARQRGLKRRPQPHIHPQPGTLDARGNCPACAVYEPNV